MKNKPQTPPINEGVAVMIYWEFSGYFSASFSVDLDGFSLRLRVEAAPSVLRASSPKVEEGSGTEGAK